MYKHHINNFFTIKKITISVLYLATYILILFGYYKFIVPIYGYMGFHWNMNQLKIVEGILLSFCLPLALPIRFVKPSDLLLHIQLLFPIIPMLVLYGAENQPRLFLYYTVIAFLMIVVIVEFVNFKSIRIIRIPSTTIQNILLLFSYCVIGSIVLFGGIRYLNFNILKVYEFRSDAASILPNVYGYLSPWVSKVLLPFSLLLAFVNKKWLLVLVSLLGSILMFGLTNHKGPLFYPFAAIGLYYVLNARNVINALLISYLFIVCVSVFSFVYMDGLIGSFMLRRSFIVPAHLNFIYYDYFSNNLLVYWSQSKLTFGFIDYPYDIDSSHLIGREYYDNELIGANTGWIGSGYMNAGVLGMFLYSILIGLFMALLNAYSRVIDRRIIVAIIVGPIISLFLSADLPTAFLNHGVILSLFIFSLFSKKLHNRIN